MSPPFPRLLPIRQVFPASAPVAIDETIRTGLSAPEIRNAIRPGSRIAVAVGSRGISNLQKVVKAVLSELRGFGGAPFIIPAMGSHGGATPEGQTDILREYGISEQELGAPVRASLEVRSVGHTPEGSEVFCAVEALQADGIILINRIKPHTDFAGNMGSGLMKMMVIGLGKRAGAAAFHVSAMKFDYEPMLRAASRVVSARAPILAGVGLVEDHLHQTARLAVIPRDRIESEENTLFQEAKRLMPKLPFQDIDLLIIDQIGKNISGSGMDPNVIGRTVHGYLSRFASMREEPLIRRIFVRDLTPETHGNAIGIGLADITTSRVANRLDKAFTYINALTSLTPNCAKMPIHFDTDQEVLKHILPTLGLDDPSTAKLVRIATTLDLEHLEISESLLPASRGRANLIPGGPASPMEFDGAGNLLPIRRGQ